VKGGQNWNEKKEVEDGKIEIVAKKEAGGGGAKLTQQHPTGDTTVQPDRSRHDQDEMGVCRENQETQWQKKRGQV